MVVLTGKTKPDLRNFDYFTTLEEHFLEVAGPNELLLRNKSELQDYMPKDEKTLLFLLRSMMITRRAEEKVLSLWKAQEIPGSIFFGLGNEATSCGVMAAMRYEDPAFPLHRDLGCDFVRGAEAFKRGDIKVPLPNLYFSQHMSKATSPSRGRDGNIHWGIPEMWRYPMISHLGTNIANACGAAFIEKFRKSGLVVFTFIGDGATSTSDFQALNQAAARKLPLIVVIDNNQWAYRTTLAEQTAAIPLSRKAEAFGIHGFTIDGTDILAVYALTKMAREIALAGEPVLMECVTYRMAGHSAYDPRTKYDNAKLWRKWFLRREPIVRLRHDLRKRGFLNKISLKEIKVSVEKELDEAIEWARGKPNPETGQLADDVYADKAAQTWLENLPDGWR